MIIKNRKTVQIVFIFIILAISTETFSQMPNKYIPGLKKFALQNCIFDNYIKLGALNSKIAKDASLWLYPYFYEQVFSLEELEAFHNFVSENTKSYYEEILPLKQEGEKEFKNGIFARCLEFYESKKLHEFIKKMR